MRDSMCAIERWMRASEMDEKKRERTESEMEIRGTECT